MMEPNKGIKYLLNSSGGLAGKIRIRPSVMLANCSKTAAQTIPRLTV